MHAEPPSASPVPTAPDGEAGGAAPRLRLLDRLATHQVHHPLRVLLVAVVLVALSTVLALRLRVRPGFEALLPEGRASVQELNRVKQRTTGVSTVFVVLEGDDSAALREVADAIVTRTKAIGRPWVGSAESGVHDALAFLKPRAGLYTDLETLEALRDDVEERWQYEVGQATGNWVDEEGYEPPSFDADELRRRFGVTEQETARYPDGYYQSEDGRAVVVTIRSGVLGTDYDDGHEALRRIRQAVEAVAPSQRDPSIRYGLAGDLVSSINEYRSINDDLTDVGLLGALLIIGSVFLYYLRLRTLWSMLLTITIGVSVTFGVTQLLIGHLNMATGFLFTIIAGNGVNSGIIYMARYLEARRAGDDLDASIRIAHQETWLPTLTASAAASAAYASLIVTEFRGFRDFGVIGGAGMLICWVCTFAFLPAILVTTERVSPFDGRKSGMFGLLPRATVGGTRLGMPFASVISHAPAACLALGLAITVAASFATVHYVRADPMEYDLKNLRTDMSARAEEVRLSRLAEHVTGHVGSDGMAILVDRLEQVPALVTVLEARREAAPEGEKPFSKVHTLQDFVPGRQAEKLPILQEIRSYLERSHTRGYIGDEDYAALKPYLPPPDLAPFDIDALPEAMARAFTEQDGTRGRVVYISPTSADLVDDAHYLFRWADSFRRSELPDGSVVLGSGRAVIYADIWTSIVHDVPRAVVVSLLLTLVVVAAAFRAGRAAAAVMFALLMGVLWMTGVLSVLGVKLNFLNFIALPITFGIGVDYAVNVMQRYRREGPGGALVAVRETGGAVVLCSLTTALGYVALVSSVNYAVRSLGIAAVLGELACLLAAVIVLPATLVLIDRRRAARAASGAGGGDGPLDTSPSP